MTTSLLIAVLGFFFAYQIYIATLTARRRQRAEDYLDADLALPGWCFVFAGSGVVLTGIGLYDHYLLAALFRFQYNHLALGIVLAALGGVLVQKRLWLAARVTGLKTLGDLIGAYYGSTALRVLLLILLLLFTIPFAAQSLARLGHLVETATQGAISGMTALWVTAFFLFLGGVIGGWRATIYVIAGQSLLVLVLMAFAGGVGSLAFDWLAAMGEEVPALPGVLPRDIPGVIQYSAGLGKAPAAGGIWTTTAILSAGLALVGIVLSPGFVFLGISTSRGRGFAFSQVWMTAGLGVGALLIATPLIGAGLALADPAALAAGTASYAALLEQFASLDGLFAAGLVLMLATALQIPVAFFAQSGANLFVIELLGRFVLPGMTPEDRRLAARLSLAMIYLAIALLAGFAAIPVEVLGTMTLALSVQFLPAILGLCWVPWISRGAVLTGLIFGILLVFFTEPFGLILFEGLFVELPWGRWPLTIHSAAWGLVFNFATCLLVSIFTLRAADRAKRESLHEVFRRHHRQPSVGPAMRGAMWSLILLWSFFALGPGAILGNWFFSEPVFSDPTPLLGLPSLWVWQVVFWLIGVFVVWWLAYQAGLSVVSEDAAPRLRFDGEDPAFMPDRPKLFSTFLDRFAKRQD